MNIVALETTGAHASVALIDEKGIITEVGSNGVLKHLQLLMPLLSDLVEKSQLQIDDVDLFATSVGPGSFTGIRIGVSTCRALCQSLSKEAIAVPTLKSFIYNEDEFNGIVCPIFDARREQIYGGSYGKAVDCDKVNSQKGDIYFEVVPGKAYDLKEYLYILSNVLNLPSEIRFYGDGLDKYEDNILQWYKDENLETRGIKLSFASIDKRYQKASSIARFAMDLYNQGKIMSYEDLKPEYMRKAEAERKLEEKTNAGYDNSKCRS
jgi:tRNA threonylcarbamoyladenosine biosynthesis protein TsaB